MFFPHPTFTLILILSIISVNTLDLSISQSVFCNLNCTGSAANPFLNISEAIDSAYTSFQSNPTDTVLNLYFQDSYYIIYESYFPYNQNMFYDWETTLGRSLTINFLPENCLFNQFCANYLTIFMKSQKISISVPTTLSLLNINIDFRDSLLESSAYVSTPCYSNNLGCCNEVNFNDSLNDCNVNRVITRSSVNERSFFSGGYSLKTLSLVNVSISNLYSIDPNSFYSYFVKLLDKANLTILNSSFTGIYVRNSLIDIKNGSSLNIENSIISDYNLYEYYEGVPNYYFSYIAVVLGGNSILTFTNFTLNNSHFFLLSDSNTIIFDNCSFYIRYSSTLTWTYRENLGFIKLKFANSLIMKNSLLTTANFISKYSKFTNKISLFSCTSNSILNFTNIIAKNLSLYEGYFLFGTSNISLTLENFLMINIIKKCNDAADSCAGYDYISLVSSNYVLFRNLYVDNIQLNYDINFLQVISSNNIIFDNFTIYNMVRSLDYAAYFFYFESYNNLTSKGFHISNFVFKGLYSFLFLFNSYAIVSFNDSSFISANPLTVSSGIFSLLANNVLTLNSVSFSNFRSNFVGSLNIVLANFITFYQLTLTKIQAVIGGFLTVTNTNNRLDFNNSIINDIMAYSQGGFLFMQTGTNILNIQSTNITKTTSYDLGGMIFLQNGQNVFIRDSFISNTYSAKNGGLISGSNQNSIFIKNTVISSSISLSNGGLIYTLQENTIIFDNVTIILSIAQQGQGGCIYGFKNNSYSINNVIFKNLSSENEGGCFFVDNSNKVLIYNSNALSVISNTESGFIYAKENNDIQIVNCTYEDIQSTFSAGFLKTDKLNQIFISFTSFKRINSASDGALFYIDNNNMFLMSDCSGSNIAAFKGGIILALNDNNISIIASNFTDIGALSKGGGIWLYSNNILVIKRSYFNEISSLTGGGGLIFAYIYNMINFEENSLNRITTENLGGFTYFSIENSMIANNNSFNNCFGISGSGLLYVENNNRLLFSNNSFMFYSYVDSIKLKQGNILNLMNNSWNVFYAEFSNYFISANENNTIVISFDLYNFSSSVIQINEIFYLTNNNHMSINYSNITIDKCNHFFTVLEQSFLQVKFFHLENFINSDSSGLFYIKSSALIIEQLYFKNNSVLNIFTIINSTAKILSVVYFTESPRSHFFSSEKSNLTLSKCYFQKKSIYNANLFQSLDSNVKMIKITAISFYSESFGSIGKFINSNLTCVKSDFGLNKAFSSGGVFEFNPQNHWNKIKFDRTIFFNNKAFNKGGCIHSESIYDTLQVIIQRSQFVYNTAFQGGGFYLDNLYNISLQNNTFSKNRVIIKKSNISSRSKGGVFYLRTNYNISNSYDYPMEMIVCFNKFHSNKAEIGGVFFIEGIQIIKPRCSNHYYSNIANYYGESWASETYLWRFETLDKALKDYNNGPDSFLKATIPNIKSGYNYSHCLLKIIGFDRFNSIMINTDENYLTQLQITQVNDSNFIQTNSFQLSQRNGHVCFDGKFKRNDFPLEGNFHYKITSPFLQRFSLGNKTLNLNLEFKSCSIGDRLSEEFECVPCESSFYRFKSDFSMFSEVCQSCESTNFYCFGGGNYTIKPGYWRANPNSFTTYLCPNQAACLGDPRNFSNGYNEYLPIYSAQNCEIGYTGALCSECEENYGYLDGHFCSSCNDKTYYLQVFGNIILRIVFTLYLIQVGINMSISISNGSLDKSRIISSNLLKIFINHMQILGFVFSLPVSFPPDLFLGFSFFLSVSPNVSEAFSVECILKSLDLKLSLQYFKLVLAGIYPFFLVLLFILFVKSLARLKSYLSSSRDNVSNMNSITTPKILENNNLNYIDFAFAVFDIVLLICYADIAKMTMAMFGCVTVNEGSSESKLLFADFRIKCDGDYHIKWVKQSAVPIITVFLFIYPIYMVIKMLMNLKKQQEAKFKFRFSYFYYAYKEKLFFWDFILLIRKLALIFINSFFFTRITDQVDTFPLIIVVLVFSIAFGLQIYFQPFQKEFHMINIVEEYSLLITFYTVIIALVYMITPTLDSKVVIGFIVIGFLLNAFFFVTWLKYYFRYNNSFQKIRNILISKKIHAKSTLRKNTLVEKTLENKTKTKSYGGGPLKKAKKLDNPNIIKVKHELNEEITVSKKIEVKKVKINESPNQN